MAIRPVLEPPRRNAPFDQEPGFYPEAGLWLYGNARILGAKLACVPGSFGAPEHSPAERDQFEVESERIVLAGQVLVTGIHNPAHQRVAIVPLRWGAPRILVFSGGIQYHLGANLTEEPFRAARLWRYQFDPKTDLVISRRSPQSLPTYALHNPTVDRLVVRIVARELPGLLFESRP